MKKLKEITDELTKNNPNDIPQTLTVIDDLKELMHNETHTEPN